MFPPLPGTLTLCAGSARDYNALALLHYHALRPATFADVVVIRFAPSVLQSPPAEPRVVAVGVLSYPAPSNRSRHRYLAARLGACVPPVRLHHRSNEAARRARGRMARFLNRQVRTISRVIVHPQFRGIGLASTIVRALCHRCPTRFVEASATMGEAHPLFERAGFTRLFPLPGETTRSWRRSSHPPAYFMLDRKDVATNGHE